MALSGARGLAILVVAGLLAAGCAAEPPGPTHGPDATNGRPLTQARGVIAAAHPLAAEAGAQMLRSGGNALDAAAAVQWTLNVVEPPMSGLGGGTFILAYLAATGEFVVIDGREHAPAAATPDQWQKASTQWDRTWQGLAVGVPGTLAAFDLAVRTYGNLTLQETFGPAIDHAAQGFPVNEDLAANIALSRDKLASWPASAQIFLPGSVCGVAPQGCVGGRPLAPGEKLVQPDLARTFRILQEDGVDAFYRGKVGAALVEAQKVRNGRMTTDDLAAYAPTVREALHAAYGPYDVYTMPPPGSGLTVLETLKILEPFELKRTGLNSAATLHVMMEAAHLAYADRDAYLGDPAFVDVPVDGLLHPDYLAERRALVRRDAMSPSADAGDPWKYENRSRPAAAEPGGGETGTHTTHFTVVDTWGNVVAVTTTIESVFGTGMVVPGFGFLMNNELTDFSATPGGANQVEPGKTPLSAMSPTIVLRDGAPVLATGSPGGRTIIYTVFQILLNVLEHGASVDEGVKAARVYSPTPTATMAWEPGVAAAIPELARMGHNTRTGLTEAIGNANTAGRTSGDAEWVGVFDARRQGGVVYVAPREVVG